MILNVVIFSGIFGQILHYFGKMTQKMISNGNETALNESDIIENVYIDLRSVRLANVVKK